MLSYLRLKVRERTIWLPLVTELSTLGANTSPENSERPSLFPSSRNGHWARMSSRRPANCVTSIVSEDVGDTF